MSKVTQIGGPGARILDADPPHGRSRLPSVHYRMLEGENKKRDACLLYQLYLPTHLRTFAHATACVCNMVSSLCLVTSYSDMILKVFNIQGGMGPDQLERRLPFFFFFLRLPFFVPSVDPSWGGPGDLGGG